MLTYDLSGGLHNLPLYEQIYNYIKQDILSGELATDTALPSKRAFAKQLNVSVITIENAYTQLLSEGFIYSLPRKGFYVSNIYGEGNIYGEDEFVYSSVNSDAARYTNNGSHGYGLIDGDKHVYAQGDGDKHRYAHGDGKEYGHGNFATHEYGHSNFDSPREDNNGSAKVQVSLHNTDSNSHKQEMYKSATRSVDIIYDFASNSTDPSSFPFDTWARVTRRTLNEDRDKLMVDSPANGTFELRSAIARYLHDFRGIYVSPESIIIGAGTESLYLLLILTFGQNLMYAYENPGYQKISQILDTYRVNHIGIPMDSDGIIPEELFRRNVNIIHITPSHHFPTGITMPVKRRYELLNLAAQRTNQTEDFSDIDNTRYIIEDDYDSEFRLSGRPIPSLYSMDKNGKVIYMNTFTKSLSSTIHISYMILPPKLLDIYKQKSFEKSCPVSNFEQLPLARFITEGYYEKHINRMRTSYRKKRDILINAIKSGPLGDFAEIHEEHSGLHFVLEIKFDEMGKNISDDEFSKKLLENGVRLLPLSYYGDTRPHHFMMNYSSIPIDNIEKAVDIIVKCAV